MAKLLFRLGRWSYNRKWIVISAWLLILTIVGGLALTMQKGFSNTFTIDDTPSIDATKLLVENFPDQTNPVTAAGVNVVFQAPEGMTLEDPQMITAIDAVIDHIETNLDDFGGGDRFGNPVTLSPELEEMIVEQMTSMGLPEETAQKDAANLAILSEDKTIAYTSFDIDVAGPEYVEERHREVINDAMEIGEDLGVRVEAGGAGFGDPIQIKTTSEIIGIGIAFVVLIFTFGSLIAAGLPLITAVIGVGIGALTIVLATAFTELNNVTPVLAVMIGLAVGIDYALFILSRYRAEYKRMPRADAAGMAVGTAGSAVVFAGATVIIALVALSIADIGFLTAMGLSAAFTVFVSVLIALTFIPALLGVLGGRAFKGKIPGIGGNPTPKQTWEQALNRRSKGRTWVKFVQKVPGLVVAVVVLGLGALTIPATNLELSLPSDSTSNIDTTQRQSADLMTEGFGAGVNAPLLVIVDAHEVNTEATALQPLIEAQEPEEGEFDREAAARFATYMYVTQTYNSNVDVKNAQIIGVNSDATAAQILVTPYTGPAEPETTDLMHVLRAQETQIEDVTGTELGTTGLTAVQLDITEQLEEAMPIYLAVVVGLAIFLLILVFRSLLVPLIAGLGFLLSVGAAFGATVLFWQEGFGGFVNTPGPLISFMPIFLIGVTFGLAMDYQVFLVTRMREHYTHHNGKGQPGSKYTPVEQSVIEGFTQGSRVVTAAALIMIAVFVAFIDQPLPFIKIFGFALGAGVFFDAFFIRMGLVPASMFLMGRATWWMPKWLDRLLPSLDIEGTALEKEWEEKHAAR
ncbi:RND superfamily drug exporter [Corynebacterium deserti GIMN1.010]|uniref:RND superfamily drug exporter n=1 Tax=Corynebacterium deserti GIMN1.010 TaxID=931089 RepID=A0A0M5ITL6_9CORY|nr:MMPL family transporter [Corynebacterium deserti]ALC04731.1 RND superfamily drug exporter [Corynebacterium deserti GIMN1.010]